jgi:DNA-binding NarL/FixJ family response regulator
MDDLRVLVVAGDPLARAGLAALLASQEECTVVGQGSAQEDLDAAVEVYQPDVILWDLGWDLSADSGELEALDQFRLPVVALLPDQASAADAWTAGANGLLPRDSSADVLASALLATARGLVVLERGLATSVLPSSVEMAESVVEELTPRELEVLQLLAEGLPNKTIGHRLGISEHTVKFHVNAILGKLGAQSRTDAVVRATRLGLIIL